MSAHPYTEDQLVEQPAIGLFAELGWQTVSARQTLRGTRDFLLLGLPSGLTALASAAQTQQNAESKR